MMFQEQIERAYQTLVTTLTQTRLTLLHPQSKYRSLLLAKLLHDSQYLPFYYAMGPDDIHLKAFLNNLVHRLAGQYPAFGRRIHTLPHPVHQNPQNYLADLVRTFVQELCETAADRPGLLIFDEYDYSDEADDVHRFIEDLVEKLPPNVRLIINSRTLPRLPWVALVARRQAALLRDEQTVERDFYPINPNGSRRLHVYALGTGRVMLDEVAIDTWEGHLPRLLFFFGLDQHLVSRAAICHAFWPEMALDQAINVFHVTKRRLHKALDLDVLVHHDTHYQVNPDLHISYDVVAFVEALMQGRDEANPRRLDAWQNAIKLYRGSFLQGHHEAWIQKRRAAFSAGYVEALSGIADGQEQAGQYEQALKLYLQALKEDTLQEPLHQRVLRLYSQMGRRSEALGHFQQMERTFREQGQPLSQATQHLYQDIMDQ